MRSPSTWPRRRSRRSESRLVLVARLGDEFNALVNLRQRQLGADLRQRHHGVEACIKLRDKAGNGPAEAHHGRRVLFDYDVDLEGWDGEICVLFLAQVDA